VRWKKRETQLPDGLNRENKGGSRKRPDGVKHAWTDAKHTNQGENQKKNLLLMWGHPMKEKEDKEPIRGTVL